MIFALGRVPSFFKNQEISAQDLNNLAQNAEILEQIIKSPDRLFLSDWKLAPPLFSLIEQKTEVGDPETLEGLTFAMSMSEIDVWEGSFLYREGMHTLRLAFNTYAVIESPGVYGIGTTPVNLKDAAEKNKKKGNNDDWVNGSTSLILILKYTDVPAKQAITKYSKFTRTWVYNSDKKSTYRQPADSTVNSYTFINSSTTLGDSWTPNANGVSSYVNSVRGYHTFSMNIADYKFVPGEIVSVKFKIKTRDNKPVLSLGRKFYFSMVYANIDHEITDKPWTTLASSSITALDSVQTVAQNQSMLVDYFQKYDMPLRAAVWDQVMAGTSHFPYYGRFMSTAIEGFASWGLVHAKDYLMLDEHTSEARFYLPRRFDLRDTVSISYNVAVNTKTAFSMQGLLSKSAIAPHMLKKTRWYQSTKNAPSFIISYAWEKPGKATYPQVVGAGQMNYEDFVGLPSENRRKYGNFLARVGLTNFMGSYSVDKANDVQTSIVPEGITSWPANYPNPREFLYMAGTQPTGQASWHGFYFILPSLVTGKVPYYNASTGSPVGLEENMFLGPTAASGQYRDASIYVDNFNFTLKKNDAGHYYPEIYSEYVGLPNHSTYFYQNSSTSEYTDFTINLKESSSAYSSSIGYYGAGSGMILESFDLRAFNKASYIATFRLAEVTRKNTAALSEPNRRFSSFEQVAYSGLINYIKQVNTRQNAVYSFINDDPTFKYTPLFWTKPKSTLKHFEDLVQGTKSNGKTYFYQAELNTIYFSNLRQADYLIVRGKNITIGWGGFNKVYRDNPTSILFPAPLQLEFANSQSLTGSDVETVIIGFDTMKGLAYGERYYIQGDVYYAAESMGIP